MGKGKKEKKEKKEKKDKKDKKEKKEKKEQKGEKEKEQKKDKEEGHYLTAAAASSQPHDLEDLRSCPLGVVACRYANDCRFRSDNLHCLQYWHPPLDRATAT